MQVSDFDYELPEELIAQDPIADRSASRLLVLNPATGEIHHKVFRSIGEELKPGDCLVINNTRVIPARLFGVREGTGAVVEILLLKRHSGDVWEVLTKPGKKAKPGTVFDFGGLMKGTIEEVLEEAQR